MKEKILIVGPTWVGDMVMAQTLFKIIKQRQLDVVLDVLAPGWSAPLLSRMPEVSSFLEIPINHGELKLKTRWDIAKKIREKNYQQAIILPNSFKSALIPWLAQIPVRTGWTRELRSILLTDARRLDKKKYPLMIERFMALGIPVKENLPEVYPYPELKISDNAKMMLSEKFNLHQDKSLLALCPGAEFGPSKRWPEEFFAHVAQQKIAEGWEVILLGSKKDQFVTDKIMSLTQDHCINLAGQTALSEAIDLLSLASAVVSNDSGLMHVAAALNKPLIAVYGSTSPDFTPPLSTKAKTVRLSLDCQPCFQRECPLKHHQCMQELKPELVLNALKEGLN